VLRAEPIPAAADGSAAYTFLLMATNEEIVAMTGAGPGRRYPLDPDVWLDYACTVAGRDLTRDEWDSYLPERDFEPTCPQAG
jgi:hypothetical protein